MIQARLLSKTYSDGTQALKALNLEIVQGEFIAVIGRSGAGKTTFLKCLNGMTSPSGGSLQVLGKELSQISQEELRTLRRKIGFIFQQFNLVKNMSVKSNVMMGRLGYYSDLKGALGLFDKSDTSLTLQVLSDVGLVGRENSRVDQISGGQQQRVAIARALVQQPQIILADEPMASLDPKLSMVVLDLLKKANGEKKITVIVNLHVLELARNYAHRILGFKQGELVFDGAPSALTEDIVRRIYE